MIARRILCFLRYTLISVVVLLAVTLTVVRVLLLNVEGYETELERTVFELTTIPIQIGSIKASMHGFTPGIILKDIHILGLNKDQDYPIKFDEIRFDIDLVQLLVSQQVLPSSQLTLVGVKLSVVRKKDGSLSIVGLDSSDSEQPYWLLKGGQYKVLNSDITWLDEHRNGQPVHFNKVDLSINNDLYTQTHEAHLLAQLPEKYGKSLRVSLSIQGNVFEADSVNGRIYVEGEDIHLAELVKGDLPLGIKILTGDGDFRLWSEWQKSELSALHGEVAATNIEVEKKIGPRQRTFKIKNLSTKFSEVKVESGWMFGVTDFALTTKNRSWPLAEFNISANDQLTELAASVTQLDLQEMSELLHFFAPLSKENIALLSQLDLKGMLKNFSIFAEVEDKKYAVNGLFENISSKSLMGGEVENITGSIKGTTENGVIDFNTKQAKIYFTKLFRQPFSVERLQTRIKWHQMPDEWRISSPVISLNTKDVQTTSKLSLIIPKSDSPVFMDLQSSFSSTSDIKYAPEYYPVSIMSKDVVDWLDNAFVSGKISKGGLLVYGKLNQFPFAEGQGVFEVLFNVQDVELQYHPEWPTFKKLAAEVLFLKDGLTINATRAKVNGLNINRALITIPSFEKSKYLVIDGQAEGHILAGLTFLQQTPLRTSIDSVLDAITPKGLTRIKLGLKIPLVESVFVVVDGAAYFKNAAVNIKSVDLDVTEVSGDLKFTEDGLFSEQIKANALGYPIEVVVNSINFNTSIGVKGKTDIKQLKKQFDFLNTDELSEDRFTGSVLYDVNLDLPATEKSNSAILNISSDLNGMAIDLPGLLKKSSVENAPFALKMILNEKPILPLSVSYKDELKAAFNVDKQHGSIHSGSILLGVGQVDVAQKKGIEVRVDKEYFDASEWVGLINTKPKKKHESNFEINAFSLTSKHMIWNEKDFGAVEMSVQNLGQHWQGNLSSLFAKGAFSIPYETTGENKIKLQMGFLNLSGLAKLNSQENELTTDDFPLISISSEKLLWKGVDLGRLELETERLSKGIRFNQINVTSKKHQIKLTADWIKTDKLNLTKFNGTLLADNMGKFLSKLGFDNDLKETEAKMNFVGTWPGPLHQFSLPAVEAKLNVELLDGRISSIEPGFGRILGFLAMEQWFKRITLDFGDLYKKGLSFNSITGQFKIAKGKALTTNLLVDAIPAQIRITGEADLLAKTLDHQIGVVPKSSGAVPIAGTIVSSIAGTITKVLTSDYEEGYFFGSKYQVTGSWDDATVTPLHEQDGLLKKTWTGLTGFSWMKGNEN